MIRSGISFITDLIMNEGINKRKFLNELSQKVFKSFASKIILFIPFLLSIKLSTFMATNLSFKFPQIKPLLNALIQRS